MDRSCRGTVFQQLCLKRPGFVHNQVRQHGRQVFSECLTGADDKSNVERVQIENPPDGSTFIIHVEGRDLIGAQDYSLVNTGCFDPVEKQQEGETSASVCEDHDGDVMVSNTELHDCNWLAANINAHSYLFQMLEAASSCPRTCPFCDNLLSSVTLEGVPGPELYANTGVEGTFTWDGIAFDFEAKDDLTITGIDIHTWIKTNYTVQVFAKDGAGSDSESTSWSKVAGTRIERQGYGKATRIPESLFAAIGTKANKQQPLYVTLDTPELVMGPARKSSWNSNGVERTPIYTNSHIHINSGSAVTYSSGTKYLGYNPNVQIHYKVTTTMNVIQAEFEDKPGTVTIDPFVGERTCDWLGENLYFYYHVCTYIEQASHCPRTCGVCYILAP